MTIATSRFLYEEGTSEVPAARSRRLRGAGLVQGQHRIEARFG
jgi:hypothetical protein